MSPGQSLPPLSWSILGVEPLDEFIELVVLDAPRLRLFRERRPLCVGLLLGRGAQVLEELEQVVDLCVQRGHLRNGLLDVTRDDELHGIVQLLLQPVQCVDKVVQLLRPRKAFRRAN